MSSIVTLNITYFFTIYFRCWFECLKQSDYINEKKKIEEFNSKNRWRKRGISIVPTSMGVGYFPDFLNQAGALVHVYTDGTVLLVHGGIEMGQGLHTKMIQIAATVLQISSEQIHISEASTDKIPNATTTAASSSSDINGMAVLYACTEIVKRLKPYKEQYPTEGWNSWITKAYFDRVSLSASGFYKTPNIGHNFDTNKGNAAVYFVSGAACSVVEIDCLTGDHQVLRTDIVMDLGESLNPAIDIGQIEGGFMQGYGWLTMEEKIYSPDGNVMSRGPGVYKIPGFSDIPAELNVTLLNGCGPQRAVYSSKGIGEPPFFLASSVFFAIKEAVTAARIEEQLDGTFTFNAPATAERIRLACLDKIATKVRLCCYSEVLFLIILI